MEEDLTSGTGRGKFWPECPKHLKKTASNVGSLSMRQSLKSRSQGKGIGTLTFTQATSQRQAVLRLRSDQKGS